MHKEGDSSVAVAELPGDTVMSEMHSCVEESEEKEAQAQAQASGQALFSERRIVGDTHRPQTFGIAFLIFYLSCKASKS